MGRAARAALAALLVAAALLLPGPAGAQDGGAIRLTPPAARALAARLLQDGQPRAAAELAEVLAERDPDDIAALLILARARLAAGDGDGAAAAARRAYAAAGTDTERYLAARNTAAALTQTGHLTLAQLWLRRAVQHAPGEGARAVAVNDFRLVRSQNPLSFAFSFSAQPSSNINNGSKNDTMTIAGLPFLLSGDARALSGTEFDTGIEAVYRMRPSDTQSLRFGVSLETQSYVLSSEAKRQAPGVDGADFAFQELEFGAGTAILNEAAGHATDLAFAAGQNWYAGDVLTRYVRGTAMRTFGLGNGHSLTLGVEAEQQWRQDSDIRSATIWTASGSYSWLLGSGDLLSFGAGVSDTAAESAAIANTAVFASVDYALARPLWGASVSFWADLQASAYKEPYLDPEPREDLTAAVGATLFFREADLYGFAPSLDLVYESTRSSLDLYDTERVGLQIGIRSAF